MKKIKQKDGTFKIVAEDYKLETGEEFVEVTANDAFSAIADSVTKVAEKVNELAGKVEANDAEFKKIATTPVGVKPFAVTAPQGIQVRGAKSFGLNPERSPKDFMAISVAANLYKSKHGHYGKYKDIMGSELFAVTLTEGTAATVGLMVIDEFETEIMQRLGAYGGLLSKIQAKPTNSNTINLLGLLTAPTVTVGAEASAMSKTDFSVSAPVVNIKEARAYLTITNALAMDAPGLAAEIDLLMLAALRKKIETDICNSAAGATEFGGTGILGNTSAVTEAIDTTSVSSLNYDDIVDGETASAELPGLFYLMHHTIKGSVRKVKDDDNKPLFQKVAVSTDGVVAPLDNINGYPVITTPAMPSLTTVNGNNNTTFMALLDPSIVKLYIRQGMSLDLFTSGSDPDGVNHNTTNTSGIRLNFRAGFETHVPKDEDANAYGLVHFKTAVA